MSIVCRDAIVPRVRVGLFLPLRLLALPALGDLPSFPMRKVLAVASCGHIAPPSLDADYLGIRSEVTRGGNRGVAAVDSPRICHREEFFDVWHEGQNARKRLI